MFLSLNFGKEDEKHGKPGLCFPGHLLQAAAYAKPDIHVWGVILEFTMRLLEVKKPVQDHIPQKWGAPSGQPTVSASTFTAVIVLLS